MKNNKWLTIMALIILVLMQIGNSQTIAGGGSPLVPESHRVKWENAGLLYNPDDIEPKKVFAIPQSGNSEDVTEAIDAARDYVNGTAGLAIIYFPEGEYYLDETIELNSGDKNIVFQGSGYETTSLDYLMVMK